MAVLGTSFIADSSVLLDLFTDDPRWGQWSEQQLQKVRSSGMLIINAVIYSEVSISFEKIEELERALYVLRSRVQEIPREALFLAGKAFIKYRRNKGVRASVLPDFYIGAHAAVLGVPVITRDPKRIKHYFPTVELISPSK